MSAELKITGIALLFLLDIVAGFWLSGKGRPLSTAILTVHKLIGLGAVVLTAFLIFGAQGLIGNNVTQTALSIASIALIVVLFGTGAVLSGKKPNGKLKILHLVAAVLEVVCLAGAIALG